MEFCGHKSTPIFSNVRYYNHFFRLNELVMLMQNDMILLPFKSRLQKIEKFLSFGVFRSYSIIRIRWLN